MQLLTMAMMRCRLGTLAHDRDERGDVPGWVLVTVMTAGLVAIIWGVAEGELTSLLRSALNSVRD